MAARKPKPVKPPICLECEREATLSTSQQVYPHRPDLWNRPMWICQCGAYTGCHDGTEKPKGRPAAKATRAARIEAHAAFDRLWKAKMEREGCSQKIARGAGYLWLVNELDIDARYAHIGMMDQKTAMRVVALCKRYRVR